MTHPEFVKCPGCSQENLNSPGETEAHDKGCTFFGGGSYKPQPKPSEQIALAIDTPPSEQKPSDKPPMALVMLTGLTVAGIFFCLGAIYGEEEGRKKGIEEYGIYKDLHSVCMDHASAMTSAWVEQLKLTNECLHTLSKAAVDANNRAVKAAEALGMPHNAVTQ